MKDEIIYIPIGVNCASTYYLINNLLRKESFPFDWIYSSLSMIKHCIETRFSVFLDINEITSNHKYQSSNRFYGQNIDEENIFPHHNLTNKKIYKCYQKRCQRFLDIIDDNHIHKVFVYMDFVKPNDISEFREFIFKSVKNCDLTIIITPRH